MGLTRVSRIRVQHTETNSLGVSDQEIPPGNIG